MSESTNATKHRYQELIDSMSPGAQYRFWDAIRSAILGRNGSGIRLPYDYVGKQLAKIIEDDTGREMEVWT